MNRQQIIIVIDEAEEGLKLTVYRPDDVPVPDAPDLDFDSDVAEVIEYADFGPSLESQQYYARSKALWAAAEAVKRIAENHDHGIEDPNYERPAWT